MADDSPDPLLTSKQVADIFQVHPDTVRRWAELGELESISLPSGHRRFRTSVIERALQPAQASEPTAAAS